MATSQVLCKISTTCKDIHGAEKEIFRIWLNLWTLGQQKVHNLRRYNTNCDQLTPWLHSTEPNCLHPDEVKHSHILRENRDIWSCLIQPLPCLVTMGYCDFLQHNATMHAGNGLVLMHTQPAEFSHGCFGAFLSTVFHSVLRSFTTGFYFKRGRLWF